MTAGEGEDSKSLSDEHSRAGEKADGTVSTTGQSRRFMPPVRISAAVGWLFFLVAVYFAVYAGVSVATFTAKAADSKIIGAIRDELHNIGVAGWNFVSPLLQLAIVLMIVTWAIERFEFRLKFPDVASEQNIKGAVAVIVVGGFLIAVLGSLPYTSDIKDVALVIIGFYFGSNAPRILGAREEKHDAKP